MTVEQIEQIEPSRVSAAETFESQKAKGTGNFSERDRWRALVILCMGMLMIVLDSTVANVALPSIQTDLGFTQSSLAWVVNAYMIPYGGFLLLAGRMGDIIGRKRIFLSGLIVFTIASMLCGAAQSQTMLIVARFLQGLGGAMTSAVILGMIVNMFPERAERARAIGVYSFVASAGGSIGLLAGGFLTEIVNWHWIFYINLPIGILTVLVAFKLLDGDKGIGFGKGADIPGAVLITSALMLGVYSIVEVSNYGWLSAHTLGFGAVTLGLVAAFIARESLAGNPLVPLRIFRSRTMSGANVIQVLLVAGLFGTFFLGALYLQRVLRFSAIQVGASFLPLSLTIGAMSLGLSARLNERFGPRALLIAGLALIGTGLALFARAPFDGHYVVDVLPVMFLLGIGGGLAFPSLTMLAMADATPSDSGLASGLVNSTGQVGGSLGLAVLATLATTRGNELIASGTAATIALTSGYSLAFGIGAVLVAAAIGIAVRVLRADQADDPATAIGARIESDQAPAAHF